MIIGYQFGDNDTLIFVDDVITSGKALRESMEKIKGMCSAKVTDMVISVDRMEIGKGGEKSAVQEVEDAMTKYKSSIAQTVSLREAVNQNRETLALSLELYKQGLTQFQNVLDAQRSLLSYQDYLVQAQGSSLIYLVQLYEALGGGW